MSTITLYHTARITQGGDWSVRDYGKPTADECEQHIPEGTVTDHAAMGSVQQPTGWTLVGILESDDEFRAISGVFAIDFGDTKTEGQAVSATTPNAGPLYLVEVRGANGSPAQICKYGDEVLAHTSGRTEWCAAVVYAYGGKRAPYAAANGSERRRVALFTSRRAAEMAVADGELWNSQTYRIRAARGEQLREGVVIDSYQAKQS